MKKKLLCLLLALSMMCVLTACGEESVSNGIVATNDASFSAPSYGGGSKSYQSESAYYESDYDTSVDAYDGKSEADIVKDYAMVIRTARLSVDVENLDVFAENLTNKVAEYGGYFEQSNVENYANTYSTYRYGYFTIRVPQEKLDEFLNVIDGASFVTSRDITSEDVSLQYVDIEARIAALKTQQETLMRLLEESDNITDTLEIERRLTDVNYEIDSYTRQQRTLASRVSYSTVTVNAREERNVEHPIREAFEVNFKDRMLDGIEVAVDTFVGIVTAIPVIIIVVAFGTLFLWLLRKLWRKVFQRKGNRQKVRYMLVPMVQTVDAGESAEDGAENQKKKRSDKAKEEPMSEPSDASGETEKTAPTDATHEATSTSAKHL